MSNISLKSGELRNWVWSLHGWKSERGSNITLRNHNSPFSGTSDIYTGPAARWYNRLGFYIGVVTVNLKTDYNFPTMTTESYKKL